MAWIHLRHRPASLGKRKKEIAGDSVGREPPEDSYVAGHLLVASDAQGAELMAAEAALLEAVGAAHGAVAAMLVLGAVEAALGPVRAVEAALALAIANAAELLAPMAA